MLFSDIEDNLHFHFNKDNLEDYYLSKLRFHWPINDPFFGNLRRIEREYQELNISSFQEELWRKNFFSRKISLLNQICSDEYVKQIEDLVPGIICVNEEEKITILHFMLKNICLEDMEKQLSVFCNLQFSYLYQEKLIDEIFTALFLLSKTNRDLKLKTLPIFMQKLFPLTSDYDERIKELVVCNRKVVYNLDDIYCEALGIGVDKAISKAYIALKKEYPYLQNDQQITNAYLNGLNLRSKDNKTIADVLKMEGDINEKALLYLDQNFRLSKENFEGFYKFYSCNMFFLIYTLKKGNEIAALNISDNNLQKWNTEWAEENLNNIIEEYGQRNLYFAKGKLEDLYSRDISYPLKLRLFKVLSNCWDTAFDEYYCRRLINEVFFLRNDSKHIFEGLLSEAYANNDFKTLNKYFKLLLRILYANNNNANYFPVFIASVLFNFYYHLGYDKKLTKMFLKVAKRKYAYFLEYQESEMLIVMFLTGVYVKKDYQNAYRALKLCYDKNNEITSNFLEVLSFINNVTKLNYSVDDVIKLDSFKVKNPKRSVEDIIASNFGKKNKPQ